MSNSPENTYVIKPIQYDYILLILSKIYNSVPYIHVNLYKFRISAEGSYLDYIYDTVFMRRFNLLIFEQNVLDNSYISWSIYSAIGSDEYIIKDSRDLVRFGTGKLEITDIVKCLTVLKPIIHKISDLY